MTDATPTPDSSFNAPHAGPAGGSGRGAGANPLPAFDISPETFWAVVIRRTRYALAIVISAWIFCTLGWYFAAPLPTMEGVSLVVWQNHGFISAIGLAVLLLICTAICSVLVHPDSPHMGLFCALLGMAGLSIRGGTVHMMMQQAQYTGTYAKVAQGLAMECVQWALIFLIAEVFSRLLHDRFFANTHWMTRSGPDVEPDVLHRSRPGTEALGISLTVSRAMRTNKMNPMIATPLAVVYSAVVGMVLLYGLMQSQHKGQVIMACFVAFMLSTLAAYLAFPRVPALAFLLAVPLTAAAGYLWAMNFPALPWVLGADSAGVPVYPGHAPFFTMRALPIDYVTAGIPGAILGYYAAYRWSLHSVETGG